MKRDLDRQMTERNIDALVVEGPDGFDAANPDFNYFVNSEHLNGLVIKKRGEPAMLIHHPWEQKQAEVCHCTPEGDFECLTPFPKESR